jgi:hypothetical protein
MDKLMRFSSLPDNLFAPYNTVKKNHPHVKRRISISKDCANCAILKAKTLVNHDEDDTNVGFTTLLGMDFTITGTK